MALGNSQFAFHTAAAEYDDLAEKLSTLRVQQLDEGSGKAHDALNARLSEYQQTIEGLQTLCHEVSHTATAQDQADVQLAHAPTVPEIQHLTDHAAGLPQGADRQRAEHDASEAKREHDSAKERHRQMTEPTEGTLGAVEMPNWGGGYGGSAAPRVDPSTPLPLVDPGTSLSGDTDTGGTSPPMLDKFGYPQMSPAQMPSQPQAMPSTGAGGTGGYPSVPPINVNRGRQEKPAEARDPLDDLRTALAGDGDTPVPAPVPVDRGSTATGVPTKADITGMNRPAVGAGVGQPSPSPQPSPMMSGPMGAGVPGGGGGGKPKPRPDIRSSDPVQHGHTSIQDAVEGGILGSTTSTEPTFKDETPRTKAETPHVLGDYPWERT